jgi:hypothetical protein
VRFLTVLLSLCLALCASAVENPTSKLWTDLKAKRADLPGGHQEFEVTQASKTASGASQASKRQIVLDMFQGKWREVFTSGSGSRIRIFDGTDLFTTEEGSNEYIRAKRRAKDEEPACALQ